MQQKLFNVPPIRLKRPTIDSVNHDEVYKIVAERIIEWDNTIKLDEAISDVKSCLSVREISREDGYYLARELERSKYYTANFELADSLNGLDFTIRNYIEDEVRKWVEKC
jgi:hypothetical protein